MKPQPLAQPDQRDEQSKGLSSQSSSKQLVMESAEMKPEAKGASLFHSVTLLGANYLVNGNKTILVLTDANRLADIKLYLQHVHHMHKTQHAKLIALSEAVKFIFSKGKGIPVLLLIFEYRSRYTESPLTEEVYSCLTDPYLLPTWRDLLKLPAEAGNLLTNLYLLNKEAAVATPNLSLLINKAGTLPEQAADFKAYIYGTTNWLEVKARSGSLLLEIIAQIVKHDLMIPFCLMLVRCRLSADIQSQKIIKMMYATEWVRIWKKIACGIYEDIWLPPTPKSLFLYRRKPGKKFLSHPLDVVVERYGNLVTNQPGFDKIRRRLNHFDAIAAYAESWVKKISAWTQTVPTDIIVQLYRQVLPFLERKTKRHGAVGLFLLLSVRFEISLFFNRSAEAISRANLPVFKESKADQVLDIHHLSYLQAKQTLELIAQIKASQKSKTSDFWSRMLWYARGGLLRFIPHQAYDRESDIRANTWRLAASFSSLSRGGLSICRRGAACIVEGKEVDWAQAAFDALIEFYQNNCVDNFTTLAVITHQAANASAATSLALSLLEPTPKAPILPHLMRRD